MPQMIFVNLPVTDLQKSKAFYEAVGAVNNPAFTDDTAACMVWSEAIHVMLLTHDKWRTFTTRPIPPPTHEGRAWRAGSHDTSHRPRAVTVRTAAANPRPTQMAR